MSTRPFQDLQHPISRPTCFAYADMLMVGVFASYFAPKAGPPLSVPEWRSHFGAWSIVSSPLVLSFDLSNTTTLDAVWSFITNIEVIKVNQEYHGHPGFLLFAGGPEARAQVWVKPQANQSLAVFVLNTGSSPMSISLQMGNATTAPVPLAPAVVLPIPLGIRTVKARDLWAHADLPGETSRGATLQTKALAPHDSHFLLLAPAG